MSAARQTPPFSLIDFAWRTALRLGFRLARLWWRVRRPRHEGALVAIHVGAAVLLVRSSYRRAWNFPGGGVRRGEAPEAAARRELAEEIGLVTRSLQPAGFAGGLWDWRRDGVHFFELRLEQLPELALDNREIIDARLFEPDELGSIALTGPVATYFRRTLHVAAPTPS